MTGLGRTGHGSVSASGVEPRGHPAKSLGKRDARRGVLARAEVLQRSCPAIIGQHIRRTALACPPARATLALWRPRRYAGGPAGRNAGRGLGRPAQRAGVRGEGLLLAAELTGTSPGGLSRRVGWAGLVVNAPRPDALGCPTAAGQRGEMTRAGPAGPVLLSSMPEQRVGR